jgi:hypothetical protein
MGELNMSDNIKLVVTFAIVLLAGIGLIAMTEQMLGPKAVLTQMEKAPAKLEVLVVDNEVWLRLIDANGQSTKYPGNMHVELSSAKTNERGGFAYTNILSNTAKIDHFDMIYINNHGAEANVYAATTEVNLPVEKGLYSIKVKYYPKGQDYNLAADIIRGV